MVHLVIVVIIFSIGLGIHHFAKTTNHCAKEAEQTIEQIIEHETGVPIDYDKIEPKQ